MRIDFGSVAERSVIFVLKGLPLEYHRQNRGLILILRIRQAAPALSILLDDHDAFRVLELRASEGPVLAPATKAAADAATNPIASAAGNAATRNPTAAIVRGRRTGEAISVTSVLRS
jgi:hypothetical protein